MTRFRRPCLCWQFRPCHRIYFAPQNLSIHLIPASVRPFGCGYSTWEDPYTNKSIPYGVINAQAEWARDNSCGVSLANFQIQWVSGSVWAANSAVGSNVQVVNSNTGQVYDNSTRGGCHGITPKPNWDTYTFHGIDVPYGQPAAAKGWFSATSDCSNAYWDGFLA